MDSARADAVALIVLRGAGDETEVLLLRRAGGAFSGAWTVVMGGVESGERAVDAARRELLEETGLRCDALYTAGELDAFYDPVRDRIVHVPFFVARVPDGEVVLEADVHDDHRWVPLTEAGELVEFAAQRRTLDEVRRAFVLRAPAAWRLLG